MSHDDPQSQPEPRSRSGASPLADPQRLMAVASSGLMDALPVPELDALTRLARRMLSAPVSLVSLVDDRRQFFVGTAGLDEPWRHTREVPLSNSICQFVVVDDDAVVVTDARHDPRLAASRAVDEYGMGAYAGVPVRDPQGHTLGSFCVIDDRAREWPDESVEVLTELAQIAESLIRARHVDREAGLSRSHYEATLRSLLGIQQVSAALAGASSVERTLQVVAEDAMRILGAGFCIVVVTEADGDASLRMHRGGHDTDQRWEQLPRDRSNPMVDVLESGHLMLFESYEDFVSAYPAMRGIADERFQARALLPVPDHRGDPLCALSFAFVEKRRFRDSDRFFLNVLAQVVSAALDRARRDEAERNATETFQREMLPHDLPDLPELDLAVRYLAASDAFMLGGDWYDAITLSDHLVMVCVGDVVGHEVPAAAAMSKMRAMTRALSGVSSDPSGVLRKLSAAAWREGIMATVALGVLDIATGTLRYSYAGHLPFLARTRAGVVHLEAGGGPITGMSPDARFTGATVRLDPGDVLLAYTDGLVERRGEAIDAGLERLAAAFERAPDRAGTALDAIIEEMLGPYPDVRDDVAVLVTSLRGLHGDR